MGGQSGENRFMIKSVEQWKLLDIVEADGRDGDVGGQNGDEAMEEDHEDDLSVSLEPLERGVKLKWPN